MPGTSWCRVFLEGKESREVRGASCAVNKSLHPIVVYSYIPPKFSPFSGWRHYLTGETAVSQQGCWAGRVSKEPLSLCPRPSPHCHGLLRQHNCFCAESWNSSGPRDKELTSSLVASLTKGKANLSLALCVWGQDEISSVERERGILI